MYKLKKLKTWHNAGSQAGMLAGAPLIVCPSTGGSVSKLMKEVCKQFSEEHKINVRLFERGGSKIGTNVKVDPLKLEVCGREDCFPCLSGGGGDCSKSCTAYEIECQECKNDNIKAVYIGETGRNGYSRGLEHQDGLNKQKEDNPLWKHSLIQHGGRQVNFKMKCLKSFNSAFMRQVNEGVRIACCEGDICMNSKMQFHQPAIVRVTASLGNANDDQTMFSFQPGGRSRDGGSRTGEASTGGRGERRRGRGRGAGRQRPRGD